MRKHDVRKWLHAILDLLPVILIPVFMIYSHRHTLTERTDVDIQYKYESNEVNTLNDLELNNLYKLDTCNLSYGNNWSFDLHLFAYDNLAIDSNYDFAEVYIQEYNSQEGNYIDLSVSNTNVSFYTTNSNNYTELTFEDYDFVFTNLIFSIEEDIENFKSFIINGNDEILPQYTDYNVIESVSVNDTNSDIMSVFMDDFNNAIDKYFNMGNVFNLGNIYNWFNTNIFNGNAPVVMFSVWQIVLYEFVMDLMFLLYGLFMWFIDMVEKLMEKPINSVR